MSINTVEIRQFVGPATVELSNVGIPEIVEVRQGPQGPQGAQGIQGATGATGAAGPNSVTSATTSDGTADLEINSVRVDFENVFASITDEAETVHFNNVTGASSKITSSFIELATVSDSTSRMQSNSITIVNLDGISGASITGQSIYIGSETNGVTLSETGDINATGKILGASIVAPAEVKSANFTAENGGSYIATATLTAADPTPSEGASFSVFVRNGTATVGGTAYATSGTIIERSYHSGAWANRVYNETPVLGANVSTALSTAVGSAGAFVVNGGALGTPSSGTLTSCTGLPISTGVSGLGTNVAAALASFTSANIRTACTDPTGSGGSLVFATSPTTTSQIVNTSLVVRKDNASGESIGANSALVMYRTAGNVEFRTQSGATNYCDWGTGGGGTYIFSYSSIPLLFGTNGSERGRFSATGEMGIGTTSPSTKAVLDLTSTTKGFLPPRMTTTERNAITSVPAGLMIYNTTTNKLNFYNGSAWEAVTSA